MLKFDRYNWPKFNISAITWYHSIQWPTEHIFIGSLSKSNILFIAYDPSCIYNAYIFTKMIILNRIQYIYRDIYRDIVWCCPCPTYTTLLKVFFWYILTVDNAWWPFYCSQISRSSNKSVSLILISFLFWQR